MRMQYLASRFALKEALVKASGRPDLDFRGIYLKKHKPPKVDGEEQEESLFGIKKPRPILTVDGDKNNRIFNDELNVCGIHSSISHEEDYAIAFVTLEKYL